MKKIININLSGRVIPIEDAAYENLQRYIESLRRYFSNEEGRDEIINDIESRIAELMNDKIKKGAAAVTESDINDIINSMGRIEDFEQADSGDSIPGSQTSSGATTARPGTRRAKGRLYRDSNDKILGGVCSGIAAYMNVDPAIVRLLFALITFGGFGFGILLYILTWIILPARDQVGYVGKRLFRNPEDSVIGGVAGGLAAYFNKEAWIFRLIFVAPLALNIIFGTLNGIFFAFERDIFPNFLIGSFTGTFFLAYIVLWIVLPQAKSPFEKMEMRGEKVDVNRIKQNVQEGMVDIKSRAQAFGEEVRTSAQNLGQRASEFANTRGKSFVSEASQATRPIAASAGNVIGLIFKVIFLCFAGFIALALFFLVVMTLSSGATKPINDFLLNGFWQKTALWGTVIFFLVVPVVAIITWIVRRSMKVRSQNRYLGWIFGGMWTLGWVCLIIFITSMAKDWRYYNNASSEINITQPALNKMTVRVDEPEIRFSGHYDWIDADDRGWDITEDSVKFSNIKVRIDKSEDSNYYVTVLRYSAGRNRTEARARAEKIVYSVSSFDNNLLLGSGMAISKEQKFRGQKVIVEIKVPVGKQIRFDKSVDEKLSETNIRIKEKRSRYGRDWDMDWDDDGYFFNWKTNVDYTMTVDGKLVDPLQPETKQNDIYEYKGSRTDDLDSAVNNRREREQRRIEQQIEKQRKKIEEENRKLEELQEKKDDEGTTGMNNKRAPIRKPELIVQIKSPIFSMII